MLETALPGELTIITSAFSQRRWRLLYSTRFIWGHSRRRFSQQQPIRHNPYAPSAMTMFRFTIRDVLWLMVVVGLAVGWWIERGTLQNQREDARRDWYDLTRSIDDSGYEV